MNRTSALLLPLFFLAIMPLHAQRINGYVALGTVASQVEGDELKGFNHWNLAGGVGAIARLDDNQRWFLSLETDYSCRGIYNKKYNYLNYYNINLDLHYVDIPLVLHFRDPYGGMQIGVGIVYSRLIRQPHDTVYFNPNYFTPDTSDMQFLKNDLAPTVEFRFRIWNNLHFSARYQYSIIPIKKDWHYQFAGKTFANDFYGSSLTFRLLWQFGESNARPSNSLRGRRR